MIVDLRDIMEITNAGFNCNNSLEIANQLVNVQSLWKQVW